MNEKQFKALCMACERLLLMGDSSLERVAIPWLHVVRPGSTLLPLYADVLGSNFTARLKRKVRGLFAALRNLAKASLRGGDPYYVLGDTAPVCDVLFVSHLLDQSFLESNSDFYFGDLASALQKQKINSVFALINHSCSDRLSFTSFSDYASTPRVILSPVLSFSEEWLLYRRTRFEARKLHELAKLQLAGIDQQVAKRAAVEAATGGSVAVLRLGAQIKELVAKLQPRAIVITYEGHSWERVAFASARSSAPGIHCIGYQHAALFNLQPAIFVSLGKEYDPDTILASGTVSQKRLRGCSMLKNIAIHTLGSVRSVTRQPLHKIELSPKEAHTCLVLPEGNLHESNLLFSFTLQCAKIMPKIQFIWRLHPSISFATLVKQNSAFRKLPQNIRLSDSPLSEDIAQSYWALYRGSTAVFQAVVSGVRPVYLWQSDEIENDVLHEVSELRAFLKIPEDFGRLRDWEASYSSHFTKIQDYCERVFVSLDVSVLAHCIDQNKARDCTV